MTDTEATQQSDAERVAAIRAKADEAETWRAIVEYFHVSDVKWLCDMADRLAAVEAERDAAVGKLAVLREVILNTHARNTWKEHPVAYLAGFNEARDVAAVLAGFVSPAGGEAGNAEGNR